MDVIGAGFGRTGTHSQKIALEQLGLGPCMHMMALFHDTERSALFHKAADGDPDSLQLALTGCRSTVDWPGTFFWRELVELHPRAKVLLSVRDPQEWYDSVHRTIFQAAYAPPSPGRPQLAPGFREMAMALVWDGVFGGRFADREHAIGVYERHNAQVRTSVPAERLLEFRASDGWEPLCDFLGVPVPQTEFPRSNDTAAFHALHNG
jgi:hypothetical protein